LWFFYVLKHLIFEVIQNILDFGGIICYQIYYESKTPEDIVGHIYQTY